MKKGWIVAIEKQGATTGPPAEVVAEKILAQA